MTPFLNRVIFGPDEWNISGVTSQRSGLCERMTGYTRASFMPQINRMFTAAHAAQAMAKSLLKKLKNAIKRKLNPPMAKASLRSNL